jgi:hypothetical protein
MGHITRLDDVRARAGRVYSIMTTEPPVPVETIVSDLAKAVAQATERAIALTRFTEEKAVEAIVEKAVEKALDDKALEGNEKPERAAD